MTIIGLLIFIIIVGVFLWLVNRFIPMPPGIKSLLNILVIILLVIYILQFFGIIGQIIPMPFKIPY